MKKWLAALLAVGLLSACGTEEKSEKKEEKAEETEETTASEPAEEEATETESEDEATVEETAVEEEEITEEGLTAAGAKDMPNGGKELNGFIIYPNVKAENKTSDGGVQFNIEVVGATEDLGATMGGEADYDGKQAIIVDVVLKNTGDKDYNVYPDQGTLVLSTGEQVEADMILSESVGGELYKGGTKKGTVFFVLSDTADVKEVSSFNYVFPIDDGDVWRQELQTSVKYQ
jgi:Domain of unknown function (DUF4352)